MFPFWNLAVEPVLAAAGARRIVEIGALRGETTVRMLEGLGPEAELHVIDPLPAFDPAEHERQFSGRYIFHRDLSLNVLPDLPAMDAALIDGDHNWYTVFNELRWLSESARNEGKGLPLLVLHDVGWPYGRRDLYYAPEQIPDEFRQPHAQQGMEPGVVDLVSTGGANPTMWNALTEGGPRNGVMTALDDFLAGYDQPFRLVVLPIYYGLAIVAEEALLEQHPDLVGVLDWLEGRDGQAALAELAERLRIDAMISEQTVFFGLKERTSASARRYLDVLKGALLNEHYIEQELRIHQLVRSIERGSAPFGESLRDPTRRLIAETAELRARRRSGRLGGTDDAGDYFPLTAMGRVRLDSLELFLDTIRDEAVNGDLVECGTGRGGGALFLRAYLDAYEINYPRVFVADPFRAAPEGESTTAPIPAGGRLPGGGPAFPGLLADITAVRDAFHRFGLLDHRVRFLQGPYVDTLPTIGTDRIALLRVGESVTGDVSDILEDLYDKVVVGGFVVVDQYSDPACQRAVDEFRARRGIEEPIQRVDWTAIVWRKAAVRPRPTEGDPDPAVVRSTAPVPLQHVQWIGQRDLSVVVVFYDMKREAARTLHSLTRAYQQGIDELDYEVIVVENGSHADERLGEEYVSSFGPEFRYLDLGEDATPSPAVALNRGIALGRGRAFALMIDGAHLLTPGVLRFGMAGLKTYEPAVVATQQWFVGPGEQGDAVAEGYDQSYEDELFDRIRWPESGYRLFDIGHFIGERDWLDGMWESNCLFVPRHLLEQAGCFDERFSMPGGGYANLDIYERVSLATDVTLVSILGEGSFHQVHGGTTTNVPDHEIRQEALAGYSDHFEELRGRRFLGHNKQMHYVGTMRPEAARTRPRRRVLPNLFAGGTRSTGAPSEPRPMPRDLRDAVVEAYWETLAWRKTRWLGHPVPQPPADLIAYQELLSNVGPDWVVETGTGRGGRAFYLASICDLLGHGQVVSIDHEVVAGRPEHPRLTYLSGPAHEPSVIDEVRALVGPDSGALVVLGSRSSAGLTFAEFNGYEPLVRVGSYVVFADMVVNGHPIWTDFGPGPYEAVKGVLGTRDDFVVDRTMDKFIPSFAMGGFLKRVR